MLHRASQGSRSRGARPARDQKRNLRGDSFLAPARAGRAAHAASHGDAAADNLGTAAADATQPYPAHESARSGRLDHGSHSGARSSLRVLLRAQGAARPCPAALDPALRPADRLDHVRR